MTNLENINWGGLPFGYMRADYNVRCTYKDGKWGEIEVSDSEFINIHIAATCLHYGQEIFEGLKAFRGKDGKIRIFRPEANAQRLINSAKGILMEPVPEELFVEMVKKVVKLNERFIPPYESGSSLYIRPVEIGTAPQVGVKPANEYTLIIFVTPVGPYFPQGFKPTQVAVYREYDRAAPCGTVAGKLVETMHAVCVPLLALMRTVSPLFSSLILRRRNISTSAVQPTSLLSRVTPISLQRVAQSCLQSPI